MKKAIIIGGGLGGLFTGALLAKNQVSVTVLEKSHVIGGGLQTFVRHDMTYETGMHILGGFQPGGSLHRICSYLGILDKLDIVPMPQDCMAEIIGIDNKTIYRLPQGRQRLADYLVEQFPAEEAGIRRYIDTIYDIASKIDLFNLRQPTSTAVHESFGIPVGVFLERFTSNPQLLNLMAFASTLYGGLKDKTPAYVHALINVLYINGTSMFGKSSQQLADALADVIRSNGGEVQTNHAVEEIHVENRVIQHVRTCNGKVFTGDVYISSLHPTMTIGLSSEGAFPRAYVSRLHSIPNSYSAFKVYYEVKADAFDALQSPVYLLRSQERFWQLHEYNELWPQGVALFMTDGKVTPRGTRLLMTVCPMSFDAVRPWENSSIGHRPDDYKQWSEEQIARITALVSERYPGFADAVVSSFAATPLTFRDWLGTPEGNMYGYSKDADNIILSHLPIQTKVSNLLLTGQCINLHGICGVPLTAIQTAEAVLGKDTILGAIKE